VVRHFRFALLTGYSEDPKVIQAMTTGRTDRPSATSFLDQIFSIVWNRNLWLPLANFPAFGFPAFYFEKMYLSSPIASYDQFSIVRGSHRREWESLR
jgi:hypothetical protein